MQWVHAGENLGEFLVVVQFPFEYSVVLLVFDKQEDVLFGFLVGGEVVPDLLIFDLDGLLEVGA